jgi:N6-L-threonylcarbamoyladenine synthase
MSNYLKKTPIEDEQTIADIAYEFQEAMVEVLAKKLVKAAIVHGIQTIGIAGGVSCSDRLREYLEVYAKAKLPEATCLRPMKKLYSTDNAAMIGVVGIIEKM